MLGPARVSGDERKIDLTLRVGRKLALGFLGGLFETLKRHPVFSQINAFRPPKLLGEPIHDALVKIVSAQMRVAVGGLHLEHAVADLKDRDIESPATEIVNRDFLIL